MASPGTNVVRPRRRWLRAAIVLALIFLVLATVLLGVGRWLVVEDPLEKASAIVVLSGRMPVRAQEAGALYRAGWAPQVWVTKPAGPGPELEAMGIPFVGEEFYSERVLMHLGVPVEAIHVLEPAAENTVAEMDSVEKALEREHATRVMIITTKAHTRRVRTLWRMRAKPGMHAIVRAARDDPFDPARWWRTSSDALDVVREVLGLANAWAGLPLKPGS